MSNNGVLTWEGIRIEEPTSSAAIKHNEIIFKDNYSDDVDVEELVKKQQKENTFLDHLEGKLSQR